MQKPLAQVVEQHCELCPQTCPWPRQVDAVHAPLMHWSSPQQSVFCVQDCVATLQPIAPHAPLTHAIAQH